jgi:hypothetical protein
MWASDFAEAINTWAELYPNTLIEFISSNYVGEIIFQTTSKKRYLWNRETEQFEKISQDHQFF